MKSIFSSARLVAYLLLIPVAVSYTHLDVYKRQGKQIALFKKEVSLLPIPQQTPSLLTTTQALDQGVTGKITDDKGEVLVGVSVQVKGTCLLYTSRCV